MKRQIEGNGSHMFPQSWEEAKQEIQRLGPGFIDEWLRRWPRQWGDLVKIWREDQNYSASKAALQIGVSPATWIRWEKSDTQPSGENKEQLRQLLETGDVIDGTSDVTREFVRLLEGEPHVKVKEMLDFDNWIGLLGVRESQDSPTFELVRTIYEDNFRSPSLWSDDQMAVRISVISSCAGYSIARLKHAIDEGDRSRWNKGAKYCLYDLIGLKKACKGSEWERVFGKSFLGGYALGMEDSYAKLWDECSAMHDENERLRRGKGE